MTEIQPPDNSTLWGLRTLGYALFASVAGALGYLLRSMDAGVPVTYGRALVEALSAGLVGLIAMWLCQSAELSPQLTAVTVAISGWLGATASIQVFQRVVWRKFGLDPRRSGAPAKRDGEDETPTE